MSAPDDIETNALYDLAQDELSSVDEEAAFSLSQDELLAPEHSDAVNVLFDLADEVIRDPSRESSLVEQGTRSEERQLESAGLSGMLARIEKRISLPVFGLKSVMADAKQRSEKAEHEETAPQLESASLMDRISAFLWDTAVILLIAVAGSAGIMRAIEGKSLLAALNSSDTIELTLPLTITVALALILSVLYWFFALTTYKNTLGNMLSGLIIVSETYRRPRLSHIIVRALSAPLSLVCFGYLPVLFGRRSMLDRLSRTLVCRKAE